MFVARILVIDDNPDFQNFMSALLTTHGYEVSTHLAAIDAVRRVIDEKPDLVLLDILLPGTTGWNILNQLKAREETRDIPVLVCTAAISDLQKIQSGLKLLGVDSITKPFEVDELLEKIKSSLASVR